MQYHASYTDGTTDTGIVDPASLPEHKRRAVAAVLDPDCTMYRMRVSDPACFGTWDTDDVLGITPADRAADGDSDVPPAFHADTEYRVAHAQTFPPIQAMMRQNAAASVLARCSRDLYDVLATLHEDDDAAAFDAVRGEALTLASEASSLGWPLDGNGRPLPECADECGV